MNQHDIEAAVRRLRWRTTPEMDRCILADASDALRETIAAGNARAPRLLREEREVRLRKRAQWLKVAAMLMPAGVVLALIFFLASLGTPSLTLAEVQAAVEAQSWVHIVYDTGPIRERWISLAEGKSFIFSSDGAVVLRDKVRNILRWYKKGSDFIAEEPDAIEIPPNCKILPWKPRTAWEEIVGDDEWLLNQPAERAGWRFRAEKHNDRIDGKEVVRFDTYYKEDAQGKEILLKQLWADPRSRLPVRVRERYATPANLEEPWSESFTGLFDFPETGPASLYDLGVPRETEVVRTDLEHYPQEAKKIVEAGQKAREMFPRFYRAIIWKNERQYFPAVEVVHRCADRYRSDRYAGLSDDPAHRHPLPASAKEILEWSRSQIPGFTDVFSEGRLFHRSNPLPPDVRAERRELRVRVWRRTTEAFFRSDPVTPLSDYWPFMNSEGRVRILEKTDEAPAGSVALRFDVGDYRADYYIDPSKDYLCVKEVGWWRQGETWAKASEKILSDFERLPSGQWFAKSRLHIDYDDPQRGTRGSECHENIALEILDPDAFPPGIFDAEKLLEGATVETHY